MTDAAISTRTLDELRGINRELSTILQMQPVDLSLGAGAASRDELVICGLLGGKDVGKSTLINALAKMEVSVDTAEVGRGTERPMAYVHEEARETVIHRLNAIDRHVTVDVTMHRADTIRDVVLVDLPDFDSEFLEHLETVRSVAPLLDRILWVVTPRKIGDRAWVDMLHDVVKDPSNVHCVLNKVDQLLADGELLSENSESTDGDGRMAQVFWDEQHLWVMQCLQAVSGSRRGCGCPHSDEHRFLVAAAFADPDHFVDRIGHLWNDPSWTKYASDRPAVDEIAHLASAELDRLRLRVLSSVTLEEKESLKAANREREQHVNVARLKQHYDLDRVVGQLAQACDPVYHQRVLNEAMGPDYCAAVAAGLATRLKSAAALADDVLAQRVERWPLLRLVHWPFGWLSRALGRRVSPSSQQTPAEVADPFDVSGPSLLDRIGLLRSRILADHTVAIRRVGVEAEFPQTEELRRRAVSATRHLPAQLETRLVAAVRAGDHRPSVLAKAGLWLILLWFPFLQPVLAGMLEMFSEPGGWRLAHGLYRMVSALSAVHLLAGLAVVAVIYIAILAGMYARGLHAIRRARDKQSESSPMSDAIDEIFVCEVVAPLVQPMQERVERLADLRSQLMQQEGNDASHA